MEYKDYYATLGLSKGAKDEDIKRAYRKLARKYHPDVSKEANAEEKFKNLQEAYEVLKDSQKRAAYDQLGSQWKSGQEFRPPPGWQNFTGFEEGMGEEGMGGFSDFFNILFGQQQARARQGRQQQGFQRDFAGFRTRGQDEHAKITITLEEAFHGATKNLQLRLQNNVRTLKVAIPRGTQAGHQLRLAQQGTPGMGGGPAGDLYLQIDIAPHKYFTLQGRDVYLTVPIAPWEAALGAEVKIPTLGGQVGLKLASGSQAGQKLRLKGRGLPGVPHAGDQYAVLQIVTPLAATEEQRALYQKMAEVMPFNPRSGYE